jgi:hypothetical protein
MIEREMVKYRFIGAALESFAIMLGGSAPSTLGVTVLKYFTRFG